MNQKHKKFLYALGVPKGNEFLYLVGKKIPFTINGSERVCLITSCRLDEWENTDEQKNSSVIVSCWDASHGYMGISHLAINKHGQCYAHFHNGYEQLIKDLKIIH